MDGNNDQSSGVSQDDLNKAFAATSENSGVAQQNVENIEKGVGAEQKSSKVPIIIVSIIAIVMAVVATVFAYLYFTNMPDGSGGGEPDKGQSSEGQSDDSNNGDGSGDVSRSEANIIEELKEKVGIILGKIEDDGTIRIGRSILYHDLSLFADGILPGTADIVHAIRSSKVEPISLTDDQIDFIVSNYDGRGGDDTLRTHLEENRESVAFDADDVAISYRDLFGKEIEHQNAVAFCPPYYYVPSLNLYYQMWPGCGGYTTLDRLYYVYNYDVSGDNAYVYVVAGMLDVDKLLCDVYSLETIQNSGDSIESCGLVSASSGGFHNDEFIINSSNYQNFAKYRFVFNKADDGTYYFVKVEKL